MAVKDLISRAKQSQLGKAIRNVVGNAAEGYRRAPTIQSPQTLSQLADKARQFNQFTEKYNPIQIIGKGIATSAQRSGNSMAQRQDLINQRTQGQPISQRIFRAPQQDENDLLRTGLQSGAETVGTIMLPRYMPQAAYAAGFGFGASKITGSSNREAVSNAVSAARTAPVFGAIAQKTDPLITKQLNKLPVKLPGIISGRVAPATANVAQGVGMDLVTGQQTTASSVGLDALVGSVVGKPVFGSSTGRSMEDILKAGKAMGIDGVSPRVNKVHPEDLDVMREFADEVLRRGRAKKNLGELGVSAQRLAQHYLGGKWRTADNKKLAQAFEWAIDLNMNIPREARGQLPKLGIAADQEQSVMSQLRNQPTKGVEPTISKTTPEAISKQPDKPIKPEVQQSVRQANEVLKSKVGFVDLFRTPEKVLQKIGLGKQSDEIRSAYSSYQKELPKQIDQITTWYEEVGRSKEASERIFKHMDGQGVLLSPKEQLVADQMKDYLKGWADRLGIPEDKRITNYITHLFEDDFIQKEFDPELEKIIRYQIPGSVYDPFLQKRYGIAGYKEDAFAALDAYVKRATRKVHMDPALKSLKEASKDLPDQSWRYVKQYTDRINLRPADIDNLIDTSLKQTPFIGYKLGQRPVANISRNVRAMVYRGTLGLNIGSAVRNLTQGANTYAELGARWTAKGYFDVTRDILGKSTELEDVGVLGGSMIQDRSLSSTKKLAETADKYLFGLFELAERINRGAAYYGAKARALNAGKSEKEAIQAGVDTARKTQFTFGSVDTPVALQSDIVKSLTQFQSFNIKQTEFLLDKIQKKELAGLARYVGAWVLFAKAGGEVLGLDWESAVPFASSVTDSESPVAKTPPFQLVGGALRAGIQGKDKYGNEVEGNALQRIVGDDEVQKAAGAMTIPGFTQIKKSVEGIKAFNRGYSETKSGNVRFPIEKTQGNQIKTGLFGQYSTKEAREYFDAEQRPLSKSQSELYKTLPKDQAKEYRNVVEQERKINKIIKDLREEKIDTKEAKSLIGQVSAADTKTKIKAGIDVTEKELETAYLDSVLKLPKSNRYEKGERDSKLWSSAGSIQGDENLSEPQKQALTNKIAKELGVTKEDLDLYQVAKQENNPKTLYALDQIEKAQSLQEVILTLSKGRKPVNGKILYSDGVIDNLVQDGIIPYQLGKELKNLDLNEDGTIKRKKTSSRGGTSKKSPENKAISNYLANLAKISLPSGKIRTQPPVRINVSDLTFGS